MDSELISVPARSVPLQIGFAVGHMLNDVTASMWFTYFLVFFQNVLQFSHSQTGYLMFIGQIVDAVATPSAGYCSDHTNNVVSDCYGKRKLWHLFGTVCTLLSFPFIFMQCLRCSNSHIWAQMLYFAMFITIFQIAWAAVQVNHMCLIPELSEDEATMTHLTAIRYVCTVFSNMFVYLITWAVLHITGDSDNQVGPGDVGKFSIVTYISLAVGFLGVLLFHILVKEPRRPSLGEVHSSMRTTRHLELFKEPALYQVGAVYMCSRLLVNVSQAFLPLYTHNSLHLPSRAIALAPLALYIGALVGAAIARFMKNVRRAGIRYLPGAAICFGASLAIFWGRGKTYDFYLLYVVSFALGLGGSLILVVAQALCAQLVGTRTHLSAFVYGLMSFTDKISTGMAIVFIQMYSEGAEDAYYKSVLTFVTIAASCVGFLIAVVPSKVTSGSQDETSPLNERSRLLNSTQS